MANCYNYNCDDPLGDHLLNDCGNEKQGGIKDAIILECNHQLTDPSNATQIETEIAAGRATLVLNLKIGIDAPSPVEVEPQVACSTPKVVTYDRTASWVDGNVNGTNIDFYNNLTGGQAKGGVILHECGADEVTWIDDEVRWVGGRVVPNNDNEFQRFEATVKWRSKTDSGIYATPAGIF
jgi:hypothetical protein